MNICKKRTAAEAGISSVVKQKRQEKSLNEKKRRHGANEYAHWYHHIAEGCSCGGRRYRKKKPIEHSDETLMGKGELKRCTWAKDGRC